MPTKSRTRTEYSIQAPVRVLSRDLKRFDHAGGGQQPQKTKFPLAFHSRLCLDLILSPTPQDPNLPSNEYRSGISNHRQLEWTVCGHIIHNTSSSKSIAAYLSETLDVLKRLVETELLQNQMMPSRVAADGIGPTTKEKEYGRTDYRLTIYPVE